MSEEEVMKVVDQDSSRVRVRPSWSKQRAKLRRRRLSPDALKWMSQLPKKVRPFQLARLHPQIVNEISKRWDDTVLCDRYFAELIVFPAMKRQRLSPQLAAEIADLAWYRSEFS